MSRRFLTALALLAAPGPAPAQTSIWTNAANGTFNVVGDWTGGGPGATSTAVVDATGNRGRRSHAGKARS